MQTQLQTPVALIIFNRPDLTARVFDAVRKARPETLLIISDGPRSNVTTDIQLVALCRDIINQVDWPCRLLTNFSDVNLGCGVRVSTGLDWVFSIVNEAIVIEDDCLPSEGFFRFTSELLERYRHDSRVGSVCGTNASANGEWGAASYHFSKFPLIWGWATWARVWKDYDISINDWPKVKGDQFLTEVLRTRNARRFWISALDESYSGKLDTWDYQFSLLHWKKNYLSIIPSQNLVSNLGFGIDATHTVDSKSVYANLPREEIGFPLLHPDSVIANEQLDLHAENSRFAKTWFELLAHKIYAGLPRMVKMLVRNLASLSAK